MEKDVEPTADNVAQCQLKDSERTVCEVWTRVVGYHRPVSVFNEGKRSEHRERKYFSERLLRSA